MPNGSIPYYLVKTMTNIELTLDQLAKTNAAGLPNDRLDKRGRPWVPWYWMRQLGRWNSEKGGYEACNYDDD